MKKNQKKTRGVSKEKKRDTKKQQNLDISIDNSLDDIFRIDDKMIGKRTHMVFEAKTAEDGFYDFDLKSDLKSEHTFNESQSISFYKVDAISDMDDKKNEKMIRMLKQLQNQPSQFSMNDLHRIERLIEESQVQESGKKINEKSDNNLSFQKIENSEEQQDIPTIQKKNPFPNGQSSNNISVDQEKSTKSKCEVKVDNVNKNVSDQKNQIRPNLTRKSKRLITSKDNNISQKSQKDKNKNKITGRKISRKRPPRSFSNSSQEAKEQIRHQKFLVRINLKHSFKEKEYCPFGMTENGRYPLRLRIPPLRGWDNEKRNYKNGFLSSITLIDDERGRTIEKKIKKQNNEQQI